MKTVITFCLLIQVAWASLSREVYIRGKIGNEFDDQRVKITDQLGQTYYLSRHLFPKDFKFKQGETFAIEVDEKELEKIKVIKK